MSSDSRAARRRARASVRAFQDAYVCHDCGATGRARQDARGVWTMEVRHEPGCPVPAGQTPNTGARAAAVAAARATGTPVLPATGGVPDLGAFTDSASHLTADGVLADDGGFTDDGPIVARVWQMRHATEVCEHFDTVLEVFGMLALPDRMVCQECLPGLMADYAATVGRDNCDVCGDRSEQFRLVSTGPTVHVTIVGEVCPACWAASTAGPRA